MGCCDQIQHISGHNVKRGIQIIKTRKNIDYLKCSKISNSAVKRVQKERAFIKLKNGWKTTWKM